MVQKFKCILTLHVFLFFGCRKGFTWCIATDKNTLANNNNSLHNTVVELNDTPGHTIKSLKHQERGGMTELSSTVKLHPNFRLTNFWPYHKICLKPVLLKP